MPLNLLQEEQAEKLKTILNFRTEEACRLIQSMRINFQVIAPLIPNWIILPLEY